MPDALPRPFGRYILTHLVGEGGMAEVYKATSRVAEGLSKDLAIKKIRPEFASHEDFARMFVDEAKIALSLNHANIVQVFDFGKVRDDHFLAMEWVDGIDLMRLFQAVRSVGDAFPPVIAAYIGHQVASGLAYAHRKTDEHGRPLGIVHRDISPHNIMVSYAGQVKILDFGIARTGAHGTRLAPSDGIGDGEATIKGKVAYMSPEQAAGRPVDPRSDIYALGIVLHELLTGELLYRDKDRMAALARVRSEPPPPLAELAPHVPAPLVAIVERALARDPDDRYPSARAMRADLAAFLHTADPVVDDEVLAEFVAAYTERPPTPDASQALADQVTRDLGDSQGSAGLLQAGRGAHRIVVVRAVLELRGPGAEGTCGEVPPSATRFDELVRNLAFKRDATVLDSGPDGALVAFGCVLATEDDPDRAVRFAQTVRDELPEVAPGFAIGTVVATVPAVIENAGQPTVDVRLRPAVRRLLDRVARSVLDGPVVVGQDLADRLAGRWRFGGPVWMESPPEDTAAEAVPDLLEPVRLLGPARAEPAVRAPLSRRGRLVGRDLELKALRDALTDAIRAQESRTMLVLGEPGMGKRALVERFLASLPRTSCWVLRGSAAWSRRNVPLGAFVDLLAEFLGIGKDTPRAQVAQTLTRYGVRDAPALTDALAAALGLADAPAAAPEERALRDAIWRLLRRLVRGLGARRPVIVVLENAHFLDPQSLELLEAWNQARQSVRLLGILTARPGPSARRIRSLPAVATVVLQELDPRARRDLILQRFEHPSQAEPLADRILAKTGGNPLFIEQTLAKLLADGVLGWSADGRFLVPQKVLDDVEVPPTVEAVLRERVDNLAPEDRTVLQVCAVLGRTFVRAEAERVLDRAAGSSFLRLEREKFLEFSTVDGRDQGRFVTVSLHEVVRAQIPADQAALWHGRAADVLRQRPSFRPGLDDGVVAEHLVAAGRLAEAAEHALAAARAAAGSGANKSAHYYLSIALEGLADDDPRRFEALAQREEILRGWGKMRTRAAEVRRMIEAADRIGKPDLQVAALLRLLRFYIDADKLHRAEQLVGPLAERLSRLEDPASYAPALGRMRAQLLLARGRFEEARQVAEEALAACRDDRAGMRQRCRLLSILGQIFLESGRYDRAERAYADGLALARDLGDLRLTAELENALGEAAGRGSRYQAAIDHFKAALAIDRDLGDRINTGRKLANLGITYAALGLHGRAERFLRKALDLHERLGRTDELGDVVVHLGEVVAALGDPGSARTLLEEAARIARRRGDLRMELRAKTHLAFVLVEHARDDEDRARAEELAAWSLEHSRRAGLRTAAARAHHVLSRIRKRRGDIEGAVAHAEEAVARVRAGAARVEAPRYLHHLGRLLVATGRTQDGARYLAEAADLVEARLSDLREADLRRSYLELAEVRTILADAGRQPPAA